MGAGERRSVAAVVGLTIVFTLLLYQFGNISYVAAGRDWLTNIIKRNSTLSVFAKLHARSAGAVDSNDTHTVYDTLKPTTAGAVESVSNVFNNTGLNSSLVLTPILVLFWTVFFGHRDWYWVRAIVRYSFAQNSLGSANSRAIIRG